MKFQRAQPGEFGSANNGFAHWWAQRLTAAALVPFSLWFAGSLISVTRTDYTAVVLWIGNPLSASLLILFLAIAFYHAQLGLQLVIEDYVHLEQVKIVIVMLVKVTAVISANASILAVLTIAIAD